ncbi:hypothetical protein P4O66_010608 [Electrophorus voltai]|uniref:Uncharacterized protein n=1 Tax=Electrophorus voltai TaxID=2609070 RepID=A0AAD9DVG2_9TELE|nr:hypothetical protein P4O66_010608 [Electrophorus voltai]
MTCVNGNEQDGTSERDIWDCNLLCFIESWLRPAVPSQTIQPDDFFLVYHTDRTTKSGKPRGGEECVMVNSICFYSCMLLHTQPGAAHPQVSSLQPSSG